jgi:flavoprotein
MEWTDLEEQIVHMVGSKWTEKCSREHSCAMLYEAAIRGCQDQTINLAQGSLLMIWMGPLNCKTSCPLTAASIGALDEAAQSFPIVQVPLRYAALKNHAS